SIKLWDPRKRFCNTFCAEGKKLSHPLNKLLNKPQKPRKELKARPENKSLRAVGKNFFIAGGKKLDGVESIFPMPDFKMKVRPTGSARASGEGDLLALFHLVPFFHQIFGMVGINGKELLGVLEDHHPAISADLAARVNHRARSHRQDGGTGLGPQIHALVEGSSSLTKGRSDLDLLQGPRPISGVNPKSGPLGSRQIELARLHVGQS